MTCNCISDQNWHENTWNTFVWGREGERERSSDWTVRETTRWRAWWNRERKKQMNKRSSDGNFFLSLLLHLFSLIADHESLIQSYEQDKSIYYTRYTQWWKGTHVSLEFRSHWKGLNRLRAVKYFFLSQMRLLLAQRHRHRKKEREWGRERRRFKAEKGDLMSEKNKNGWWIGCIYAVH